jgi:hypothetical protein
MSQMGGSLVAMLRGQLALMGRSGRVALAKTLWPRRCGQVTFERHFGKTAHIIRLSTRRL